MSLAPMRPDEPKLRDRLLSGQSAPRRRAPNAGRMARRRWFVRIAKFTLPLLGLALLASIALWPEIMRLKDQERLALRRLSATEVDAARVVDARYRGVDQHGRPYTLTANSAQQVNPERINLVAPKGDVTSANGTWIMLQGDTGVYMQHLSLLDLSGNVTLYREDGTTVTTDTATVDLKAGAAASNDRVHAEGPFGTLDAQAFAITDNGNVMQFTGPARLVMNGAQK